MQHEEVSHEKKVAKEDYGYFPVYITVPVELMKTQYYKHYDCKMNDLVK